MKCWCEHLAAKSFINTYETFHSFKRKRNQITCFIRTYCGGLRWYAFSCNSLISHVIPSISNLTGTICISISLVRHFANTNELYKTLSAALHSCAEFRLVFNFPFVQEPFLKFHTLSIICTVFLSPSRISSARTTHQIIAKTSNRFTMNLIWNYEKRQHVATTNTTHSTKTTNDHRWSFPSEYCVIVVTHLKSTQIYLLGSFGRIQLN